MNEKTRVLLSCHSSDMTLASKIADTLTEQDYDHMIITEESPVQCRLRGQAVEWAGVVVILMSSKYQYNKACMQIAHEAKICREPITAVLVQPNYNPTGALGIISFAGGDRIDFVSVSEEEREKAMEVLLHNIKIKMPNRMSDAQKPADDSSFRKKFGDIPKSVGTGVFISYYQDDKSKEIVELIRNGKGLSQNLSNIKMSLADQLTDSTAAIKRCKAFVAIITRGYQESFKCENEFECARAANRDIIPVKVDENYYERGWLATALAGLLCHEIYNNDQAYKENPFVPNTTPMNDFVEAVLSPAPPSQEEANAKELAKLRRETKRLKSKILQWPPQQRPPQELRDMPVLGWDDLVPAETYHYDNLEETPFYPPKPLVNTHGRPLDQEFDVMLSYELHSRPFVQDVYKDLEIRGFKPWMAFTGMRGNLHTAMATAVEQSHVVVAFLTEKYLQGNLALPYALSRNKPVIFIKAQPDLVLKGWVEEAMSERLVFQMSSITSARIEDFGVTRIDRLSRAIHLLSEWDKEKEIERNDVSEEVFIERNQLQNAYYWARIEKRNSNMSQRVSFKKEYQSETQHDANVRKLSRSKTFVNEKNENVIVILRDEDQQKRKGRRASRSKSFADDVKPTAATRWNWLRKKYLQPKGDKEKEVVADGGLIEVTKKDDPKNAFHLSKVEEEVLNHAREEHGDEDNQALSPSEFDKQATESPGLNDEVYTSTNKEKIQDGHGIKEDRIPNYRQVDGPSPSETITNREIEENDGSYGNSNEKPLKSDSKLVSSPQRFANKKIDWETEESDDSNGYGNQKPHKSDSKLESSPQRFTKKKINRDTEESDDSDEYGNQKTHKSDSKLVSSPQRFANKTIDRETEESDGSNGYGNPEKPLKSRSKLASSPQRFPNKKIDREIKESDGYANKKPHKSVSKPVSSPKRFPNKKIDREIEESDASDGYGKQKAHKSDSKLVSIPQRFTNKKIEVDSSSSDVDSSPNYIRDEFKNAPPPGGYLNRRRNEDGSVTSTDSDVSNQNLCWSCVNRTSIPEEYEDQEIRIHFTNHGELLEFFGHEQIHKIGRYKNKNKEDGLRSDGHDYHVNKKFDDESKKDEYRSLNYNHKADPHVQRTSRSKNFNKTSGKNSLTGLNRNNEWRKEKDSSPKLQKSYAQNEDNDGDYGINRQENDNQREKAEKNYSGVGKENWRLKYGFAIAPKSIGDENESAKPQGYTNQNSKNDHGNDENSPTWRENSPERRRFPKMFTNGRVLVSCHSSDLTLASKIADAFALKGYDRLIMTEERPVQCRLREQAVQWAGVVLILISSKYQHNQFCMQIAHNVKDCRQPITAVLVQPNYHPRGALGILSFAGGNRMDFTEVSEDEFPQAMEVLEQDVRAKMPSTTSGVPKPSNDRGFRSKFGDIPRSKGTGVFVSYHHDAGAKEIAELIRNGRGIAQSLNDVKITLANQDKDNTSAIKMCKTFVAIVTPGYQESTKCEKEFECARAANKVIIPVKVEHKFCPAGWLAIGIAGMLCHEIHDSVHAYAPNPYVLNANPMNDLIEAILAPTPPSQEKIEAEEIAALRKECLKYRSKLGNWPPKERPPKRLREMPSLANWDDSMWVDSVPVGSYDSSKSETTLFIPPKPLVDIQGRPLKQEFDVMLSYQIDTRPFVQDVYKDIQKRGFNPWMAFTGMRGNLYTAMATAIEQSHVFVAFLTEKYQKGLNLALPYALSMNKPVIFIKAQPDLMLKDWIKETISHKLVLQMSSAASAKITDYGMPRMDRLSFAIGLLSKWDKEKEKVNDDVSLEVFKEREMLENAKYWAQVKPKDLNQNYNGDEQSRSNQLTPTNERKYKDRIDGQHHYPHHNTNGQLESPQRYTKERPTATYDRHGYRIPYKRTEDSLVSHSKRYNGTAELTNNSLICSRCGVSYVGYSKYGCRKHSKYFREGTLIIGKWMCCDKRGKDAPGCTITNHTTAEKVWEKQSTFEGTDCCSWVFKSNS